MNTEDHSYHLVNLAPFRDPIVANPEKKDLAFEVVAYNRRAYVYGLSGVETKTYMMKIPRSILYSVGLG